MTAFQIAGIGLAAFFVLLSLAGMVRGRISRRVGFAWTAVWIAAGAAIAWPEITVVVARRVGIARGADLVFYCAILAMLVGFFAVYVRLRRIDQALTAIVRHIALAEVPPAADGAGGRAGDDGPATAPLPQLGPDQRP